MPETEAEAVSAGPAFGDAKLRPLLEVRSNPSPPSLSQAPPARKNQSRFRRKKTSHLPTLELSHLDLSVLDAISKHRLLTTTHLLSLFPNASRDTLYTRLRKLYDHGYLARLPVYPNQPNRHRLAPRGAEALGLRFSVSERKSRYLAHHDMIVSFKIALERATQPRSWQLDWLPSPEIPGLEPDAFFRLTLTDRPAPNKTYAFLECDRGTESRKLYASKLQSYLDWYESGGAAELGIKALRILTVTKSEGRLRSLSAAAPPDPLFWFTAEPRLPDILGPIWHLPAEPETLLPLIPDQGG